MRRHREHAHDIYRWDWGVHSRRLRPAGSSSFVVVETIGDNQPGTVVCIFRRSVMVPKQSYLQARRGSQPARSVSVPDCNWLGRA